MTSEYQQHSLAAPPPGVQPPRLAGGGSCSLPNTNAAPSTALPTYAPHPPPPSHTLRAYDRQHATLTTPFVTVWVSEKLRRLKTQYRQVARSLNGQSRQEKNAKRAATLNTAILNTTGTTPSARRDVQSNTAHDDTARGAATQPSISQHRTAQDNTWNVLIHIFYAATSVDSDVRRSAVGRFDSQCPLDLMSSTFAAMSFGLNFDNAIPKPVGETITGGIVYSIGEVTARWAPVQDVTLSSPSGDKITIPARTHITTFHVIQSDRFDVFVGHPSLENNGLYGERPKLLNPFRSYGSRSGPTATSSPAQDQEYLRRMEAERQAVAKLTQPQVQGTPKK